MGVTFSNRAVATLGGTPGEVDGTTADNDAEIRGAHVRYEAPIAAELVSVVAAVDIADGALTIAAQPDYPRKLQVGIVDANSSVSAGKVTLVGVGASGEAVTEEVTLTGGTATKVTTNAYATLTSATVSLVADAAAGDTVSIGVGAALGLPRSQVGTALTVYKTLVNNAAEAVGTVDATAGTVAPTTAANGARTFDFFYRFTVDVQQQEHTHPVSGAGHVVATADDDTPGPLEDKLVNGTGIALAVVTDGGVKKIEITNAFPDDKKVKLDAGDTAGYLEDKVIAGDNITVTSVGGQLVIEGEAGGGGGGADPDLTYVTINDETGDLPNSVQLGGKNYLITGVEGMTVSDVNDATYFIDGTPSPGDAPNVITVPAGDARSRVRFVRTDFVDQGAVTFDPYQRVVIAGAIGPYGTQQVELFGQGAWVELAQWDASGWRVAGKGPGMPVPVNVSGDINLPGGDGVIVINANAASADVTLSLLDPTTCLNARLEIRNDTPDSWGHALIVDCESGSSTAFDNARESLDLTGYGARALLVSSRNGSGDPTWRVLNYQPGWHEITAGADTDTLGTFTGFPVGVPGTIEIEGQLVSNDDGSYYTLQVNGVDTGLKSYLKRVAGGDLGLGETLWRLGQVAATGQKLAFRATVRIIPGEDSSRQAILEGRGICRPAGSGDIVDVFESNGYRAPDTDVTSVAIVAEKTAGIAELSWARWRFVPAI